MCKKPGLKNEHDDETLETTRKQILFPLLLFNLTNVPIIELS